VSSQRRNRSVDYHDDHPGRLRCATRTDLPAGVRRVRHDDCVPSQIVTPPRRQHTVSRVVLRRFASDKRVSVYDRDRDAIYSKGPGGIFQTYLDKHDPWSAEERWGKVEARIPWLYQVIDDGRLLAEPAAADVARDLVAMHWVRSPAMRARSEIVRRQTVESRIQALAPETDLLAIGLRQEAGLIAAGDAGLQWFNRHVHEGVLRDSQEELNSDSLSRLYKGARTMLASRAVQVGHARQTDLMIGDSPVVTMRKGQSGVGPHQGVALGDASLICMPIDPHVLITLGLEPGETDLSEAAVCQYNAFQERGFIRWLGCRPGGTADAYMRRTIKARSMRP
jgi:hypothetical protein